MVKTKRKNRCSICNEVLDYDLDEYYTCNSCGYIDKEKK
jgi:hypothetical protein